MRTIYLKKMAKSQNNGTTHDIEKIIKDKIINNNDYELMEKKLRRFDDIDEEPTIGNLASLLFYATQFEGGDYPYNIIQAYDNSTARPFETFEDDVVVITLTAQKAEEERNDEARDVTPIKGLEVINSFGDLIGWLDLGATPEIRAASHRRRLELSPLLGEVLY